MQVVEYAGQSSGDYILVSGLTGLTQNQLRSAKSVIIGCTVAAGAWSVDDDSAPTAGFVIPQDGTSEVALSAFSNRTSGADGLYILDNGATYTFLVI